MQFTSEQQLESGVLERHFTLGEIPGTLWTPPGSAPAPLVLTAHNNGLPRTEPRLVERARLTAADGYAVASVDAAGCADRPRTAEAEQARAELRRAMQAGEPADAVDEIFESFVGPMVENAAPDWLTALDALLARPEVADGPVGYTGWAALGIRLAAADPRIAAAGLFAGGYVPRALREEAPKITVPLLVLLQWDEPGNLRKQTLELYDSFGSAEKTLHINRGGHLETPWFERADGDRFFGRHLT